MTHSSSTVLHLLLLELQPGDRRQAATQIAAGVQLLEAIPAVEGVWAGLDTGTPEGVVVVYAVLHDVLALADFGLDPGHIRFLGQSVRPLIRRFTSVDLLVAGGPPVPTRYAHVVCAAVAPAVFEPQLRRLAAAITELRHAPGIAGVTVGQAIDTRQPYRLGTIVSLRDQASTGAYRQRLPFAELVGPQWSQLVSRHVEYLVEEMPGGRG